MLNIFQDSSFHQYFLTYKSGRIGVFFVFENLFLIHFIIFSGIRGRKVSMAVLHVTFSMALQNKNANDVMHRMID